MYSVLAHTTKYWLITQDSLNHGEQHGYMYNWQGLRTKPQDSWVTDYIIRVKKCWCLKKTQRTIPYTVLSDSLSVKPVGGIHSREIWLIPDTPYVNFILLLIITVIRWNPLLGFLAYVACADLMHYSGVDHTYYWHFCVSSTRIFQ